MNAEPLCRAEERRLKEAGYDSNDEKGTGDVPMDDSVPVVGTKNKTKKRKLSNSDEPDDVADFDMPEDLDEEPSASPAVKRSRGILESDDDV